MAESIATVGHSATFRRARGAGAWWRTFRSWPLSRRLFVLLLAIYVVKQVLSVIIFPPFTGHDEVAHFSYLRTVATEHRVPIVPDLAAFRSARLNRGKDVGDYLPNDLFPYCRYVLDWNYCNETKWLANPPHAVSVGSDYYPYGWQYAANHPPLFYVVMTPLYWLSERASSASQLHLIRAATIPFGLATVLLAYLTALTLFPGDGFIALGAASFVAFQPQISYESAMVNNDIAGIATYSLLLYLLIRGIRRGFTWRLASMIGLAFGLGLLFKSTTLTIAPVIAFAMVAGVGWRRVREWAVKGSLVGAIAGLLVLPWYLFLYRTYGNFSGLDQIAALQWAYTYRGETPPTILGLLWNRDFGRARWAETWGEFGWRLIHLRSSLLLVIGVPCVIALLGLVFFLLREAPGVLRPKSARSESETVDSPTLWQLKAVATLFLTCIVAYGGVLQFGTRFALTQARYFFPAINAIALLLALGWRMLIPPAALRYGTAALFVGLSALNVVMFTQYVLPFWYLQ